MSMKTAIRYQIWEAKKSLLIYYGVIYAIFVVSIIAITSLGPEMGGTIGGFETASMIFLFIAGLNSFKETFRLFLQNGLSRKTLFISFIFSIIPIAVFMSAIDSINAVLAKLFYSYESAYIQFYAQRYGDWANGFVKFFEGLLWNFFAYAMFGMIGFFITTLYYRMNKGLKLLVSIGTPVFFFVILPLIDSNFTNGVIFKGILDFFAFAWGYKNGFNPYYSMVTCTSIFAVFGGLSYLLIRKAVVKE